ncbi:hypothetical protein J6590_065347 [Homalodisca vitripennis]|nr:hypothetical protein J6590_065347 [Homalodisca vitripennis]
MIRSAELQENKKSGSGMDERRRGGRKWTATRKPLRISSLQDLTISGNTSGRKSSDVSTSLRHLNPHWHQLR